jgi:hypothetical protein
MKDSTTPTAATMTAIASSDSSVHFAEIDLSDAFGVRAFVALISEKTVEHSHWDAKKNRATITFKGGLQVAITPKEAK